MAYVPMYRYYNFIVRSKINISEMVTSISVYNEHIAYIDNCWGSYKYEFLQDCENNTWLSSYNVNKPVFKFELNAHFSQLPACLLNFLINIFCSYQYSNNQLIITHIGSIISTYLPTFSITSIRTYTSSFHILVSKAF